MNTAELWPMFFLKLILIIVGLLVVMWWLNKKIRRKLNVEKLPPNQHLNKQHEQLDWTIRIITIMVIVFGFLFNKTREYGDTIWWLQPWIPLAVGALIGATAKAYMEWKYAENPRQYVATISELCLAVVSVIGIIAVGYFDLI
ncbi:DUF4181 domain-containing protein [Gracilibacillus salinarum]|uniref:DUF4181 domain-containing protein n=1 Tax=Gracilibacillus salinarum TaxID=2932255 RepID=A0ABY4GQQ3_9BACI|nr:DUF4181 domain-containing protein [Gracilibacillus salinarum]UOQ86556.1 DUF4181 domain-containing protein [Gracilibacillus salinarum]